MPRSGAGGHARRTEAVAQRAPAVRRASEPDPAVESSSLLAREHEVFDGGVNQSTTATGDTT